MGRRGCAFQQHGSAFAVHKESRQQQEKSYTTVKVVPLVQHQATLHDRDGGGFFASLDAAATWHAGFGGVKPSMHFTPNDLFNGSSINGSLTSQMLTYGAANKSMLNNAAAMRNAEFEAFEEVRGPAAGNVRVREITRYEHKSWVGDATNYGFSEFDDGFGLNRNEYGRVEWISKRN